MMQTFRFVVALSLLVLMGAGVLVMAVVALINALAWLVGA